jgi:hypothetical protein
MHYDDVEFKVKQEGVPWEETPVKETLRARWLILAEQEFGCTLNAANVANAYARDMSSEHAGVEVRWNLKGSSQGHYIRAKKKDRP